MRGTIPPGEVMGRKVLGVVVAIIVAFAIFSIFLMVASMFAPQPPKNLEYRNSAEIADFMRSLPLGAYVTATFGVLVASLAAGWMVTKISKQRTSVILPAIVGILLTIFSIINFNVFAAQPIWFLLACLVITIPFAMIGHRLAR
jgi:hypothetical protein